MLENSRFGAGRVVHANNAGAEVFLHLLEVLVHGIITVFPSIAVVVFEGVRETLEAVSHVLRAPPLFV